MAHATLIAIINIYFSVNGLQCYDCKTDIDGDCSVAANAKATECSQDANKCSKTIIDNGKSMCSVLSCILHMNYMRKQIGNV